MGRYDIEIQQERIQIQNKQKIFKEYYLFYRKKIEQLLRWENYDEIVVLFQQREVLELAQMENEFAILNIVVNIYQMELAEKSIQKVWSHMHTIEEIADSFLKSKMLLWRMEFTQDQADFIEYVIEHQISVPYVKWLLHTSAFQQEDTAAKIAVLLNERGFYVQSFAMLNYLNELSSEKEFIYCEMADIYIRLKQYQSAADCIRKIEKPSGLLEKYEQKWRMADG